MGNHHHVAARGSMKMAHNLDDRQERALMGSPDKPSSGGCNAAISRAKIDAIIAKLRASQALSDSK